MKRVDDIHEHVGHFRGDENQKKKVLNTYAREKISQIKNSFDWFINR